MGQSKLREQDLLGGNGERLLPRVYIKYGTWIVSTESYSNPSTSRNSDSVSLDRVNEIEVLRIGFGVEIPQPFSDSEEVESMQMDGMVFRGYDPRVLQNQLDSRIVRQPVKLRPRRSLQIGRTGAGVVKSIRRIRREISGENPLCTEEMGLQEGRGGHHKSDVIYTGHDPAPVRGLAGRARVDAQPDREEERVVHALGNVRGELLRIEASKSVYEGVGHGGGVFGRGGGEGGGAGGECAGVVESGGGCLVVDGDRSVHEGGGGHHVLAGALVGGDDDVGGLPRGDHNRVSLEGLYVRGINLHHRHLVAGDLEEKLFIERSVDHS
nr:hypothetical protein PanWU01x14_324450 [Ipomoea trifida]